MRLLTMYLFWAELRLMGWKQTFRNEDGTSAVGSLSLQLRDFAIPKRIARARLSEADLSRRIEISYQTLTNYLNTAETEYQLMKENKGEKEDELPAGRKKRKREEMPSTLLSEERETEFRQKEESTM